MFLASLDDLEECVDKADPRQIQTYRERFRRFTASLLESPCVVFRAAPFDSPDLLASELSETSSAAIFFPGLEAAIIGHDDFGCHVLFADEQSDGYAYVRTLVAASGLHLVRIPQG